jgi:hypothetical protein
MPSTFTTASLLALLLAGCSVTHHRIPGGYGEDEKADFASQIATQRTAWNALGLDDYEFVIKWDCFCNDEFTNPAKITVHGDMVISATYLSDGSPVVAEFRSGTIDDLFDLLQSVVARPTADILDPLLFDLTLHFPEYAFIDWEKSWIDDEQSFTVTDFTSLATTRNPAP